MGLVSGRVLHYDKGLCALFFINNLFSKIFIQEVGHQQFSQYPHSPRLYVVQISIQVGFFLLFFLSFSILDYVNKMAYF